MEEKKTKEKMSLVNVAKITDIGDGIIWLIFGICDLMETNVIGSIVFSVGLCLLMFKNIYLKAKEKDMDIIDEMAKEHRRTATDVSVNVTMLILLISALITSVSEAFLGESVKISVYSGVALVYGMFSLIKGVIFIKLENKLKEDGLEEEAV